MYPDQTENIKRSLMEYVKTLKSTVSYPGTGTGTGIYAGAVRHSLTVVEDSGGFPIVPTPESWDKVSKDELERLYHHYITKHYSK